MSTISLSPVIENDIRKTELNILRSLCEVSWSLVKTIKEANEFIYLKELLDCEENLNGNTDITIPDEQLKIICIAFSSTAGKRLTVAPDWMRYGKSLFLQLSNF